MPQLSFRKRSLPKKTSFAFLAPGGPGLGELTRVLNGMVWVQPARAGAGHVQMAGAASVDRWELSPPRQSFQLKLNQKFLLRPGDL